MTEARTLLIELGTEDLPPGLMPESKIFNTLLLELLCQEHFVAPSSLPKKASPWLYTSRRLAAKIDAVKACQPETTKRRTGPPAIQIDPDNPATRGFAKSCGVEIEQLEIHDGRLCCNVKTGGLTLQDILPSLLISALKQMNIERRMHWGVQGKNSDHTFARPIRWLCVLHGDEVIDFSLFGVCSGRTTFGHRFHHPAPLRLKHADNYEKELAKIGHVIVDVDQRRKSILSQLESAGPRHVAASEQTFSDEATATTEWPQVLNATFDEKFLSLPPEVIIQTLATGLKAFVQKAPDNGNLLSRVNIVVDVESNAPNAIVSGYERVARARLEDARFFFDQDQKTTLESRRKFLTRTLFQEKLGSLADKSARMEKLSEWLAQHCGASLEYARRAAELCKCDLGSDIVGEYPRLQGIIGGYYAKADGENNEIATAISEHYRPHGFHDIPTAPVSVTLALTDKIDTLAGFWRIGLKPSGSKDPYGLGRTAEALLLLMIENKIDLALPDLTHQAAALYTSPLKDKSPMEIKADLDRYLLDKLGRVAGLYVQSTASEPIGRTASLSESVANARPEPVLPYDFVCRLQAIAMFIEDPTADELIQTNKRISNMVKQHTGENAEPRSDLLSEPAEHALLTVITGCQRDFDRQCKERDYSGAIKTLANLRQPIDRLFDETLIMADDSTLRDNRLALLKKAHRMFLQVADFSRIELPPDNAKQ